MLAEQPGSDDVCCIRYPMSEWSCSVPQQVSGSTLLLLVRHFAQYWMSPVSEKDFYSIITLLLGS